MKIAMLRHIQLSWSVCYEFVRQTGRGFALTFGPLPTAAAQTQEVLVWKKRLVVAAPSPRAV